MTSRLARRLTLAAVLAVSAFTTACPPPWYFWRHERREERHERRDDHRDDRYERRDDRHDERDERRDDRRERHDHH
jgi:hypothetical protein